VDLKRLMVEAKRLHLQRGIRAQKTGDLIGTPYFECRFSIFGINAGELGTKSLYELVICFVWPIPPEQHNNERPSVVQTRSYASVQLLRKPWSTEYAVNVASITQREIPRFYLVGCKALPDYSLPYANLYIPYLSINTTIANSDRTGNVDEMLAYTKRGCFCPEEIAKQVYCLVG
jgi:hypothetical protein